MTPDRALRHLVSWGLSGGPTQPIDLGAGSGLATAAEFHMVTGVLIAALEDGAVTEPDDGLMDDLRSRHVQLTHRALAAESDLVLVARHLLDGQIPFRALKGSATAHLDYSDPTLRLTSDVDLLVAPDALDTVSALLGDLTDAARTVPDRRRAWTARFGKDRTLALRSGGWLDLHRMLVPGYHGLVDEHDWFAGCDVFAVADVEVPALVAADRFVHALAHAGFTGQVRLHSIRDVPIMLSSMDTAWADVVERHHSWAGLLARGVEVVFSRFDLERHPIQDWAAAVIPSGRERIALRAFTLQGSRHHWGAVLAVPPWQWPGLIVPIVVPSREYLAFYGRTPSSHIWQSVSKVRDRRRHP